LPRTLEAEDESYPLLPIETTVHTSMCLGPIAYAFLFHFPLSSCPRVLPFLQ